MIDFLNNLLMSLGGGIAVVIILLTFLKSILNKYIESLIEKSSMKYIEKIKNTFTKNLTAYEILLKKEFDYYEKIYSIYADLIVGIQDFKAEILNEYENEREYRCEMAREEAMKILRSIPELKNYNLLYQAYIPQEIFRITGEAVSKLQDNIDIIRDSLKSLFDNREIEINKNAVQVLTEEILFTFALTETLIKNRLDNLANEEN